MNSKGLMLAALALATSADLAANGLNELGRAKFDLVPNRNHVGHGSKKSNRKASNKRKQAKKARKRNRKQ